MNNIPLCQHRGPATGQTVPCTSCARTVRLMIYRCAAHGQCTLSRRVDPQACCVSCHSVTPPTSATQRSLQP